MENEQNKPNGFAAVLIAIVAIIGFAWKAEGVVLDRKIKRNRAKRSEYWYYR